MGDGGPPRFFHAGALTPGDVVPLEAEDVAHAGSSLRLRVGDALLLVDGAGGEAGAVLESAGRRHMTARIVAVHTRAKPPGPELWLGVGILKGPRFDLVLEKATELGASGLVPLETRYTEVHPSGEGKPERWRRILVAALKQSRRAWLPELKVPMEPRTLLESERFDALFVAQPGQRVPEIPAPVGASEVAPRKPDAPPARELLLVGPEGGWHPEELQLFRERGAVFISLGDNRLRAETAALALLAWRQATLGRFSPAKIDAADE
jgi:16S rRNA (uracil1498-N3)-methyltransferase